MVQGYPVRKLPAAYVTHAPYNCLQGGTRPAPARECRAPDTRNTSSSRHSSSFVESSGSHGFMTSKHSSSASVSGSAALSATLRHSKSANHSKAQKLKAQQQERHCAAHEAGFSWEQTQGHVPGAERWRADSRGRAYSQRCRAASAQATLVSIIAVSSTAESIAGGAAGVQRVAAQVPGAPMGANAEACSTAARAAAAARATFVHDIILRMPGERAHTRTHRYTRSASSVARV